jgi:hypothetical protein
MKRGISKIVVGIGIFVSVGFRGLAFGQALGSAGTIEGVVSDPTGGVVVGATVELQNAVSGFRHSGENGLDWK